MERLPTPDGGQEVIAARFVHPITALQECESHTISLMPPQYYLVTTLASILLGPSNTLEQRAKVEALSRGSFGRMLINPMPLPHGAPDGWSVLTYEGDEARGGKVGRLHRSLVKFSPGNVSEPARSRQLAADRGFRRLRTLCFSVTLTYLQR